MAWKKVPRRKVKRREAKTRKQQAMQAEQRFVQEQLGRMGLVGFSRRKFVELMQDGLPEKDAVRMLGHYISEHVVGFMDLPTAKKKILLRLLKNSALSAKSAFEPIMRENAIALLRDVARCAVVAEKEGIVDKASAAFAKAIRQQAGERIKEIQASRAERVSFPPSFQRVFLQTYSVLIKRIAGRKNSQLMIAATQQTPKIIMAIMEGTR